MNEHDLDRELNGYLDALVAEKMARGVPLAEAEREARIELGGLEQVKEQVRDARRGAWIAGLLQDVRYGLRILRRAPGFTAAAAVTLALGIGANSAMFSAVRALLLRPLPYRDESRLMYVTENWRGSPVRRASAAAFVAWRAHAQTADRVEGYGGGGDFNLTGAGEPERIAGVTVTAGFLDLLGVRPEAGRNFTADEDRPGAAGAVLLSHPLWQRRFAGDPGIVGRSIRLDGRGYTVVGVLPASFVFPDNDYPAGLLVPMALPPNPGPNARLLKVLARLQPGSSAAAMRTEFFALLRQFAPPAPNGRPTEEVIVTPLRDVLAGDVRRLMLVLQAAVALVLLIGCLNVASLQISRAIARRKEMALRTALGAPRGRLARQLLVESLLVAAIGSVAGLVLAYAGVRALRGLLPANLHLLATMRVDGAVLFSGLAVSLLAGILTGIAPACSVLTELTGRNDIGGGRSRLRSVLVVAEVALAMVLLSGSGLLIRSFARLSAVSPGFDPHGVLSLNLALPGGMLRAEGRYARPESRAAFFAHVVERAAAIPSVESAAVAIGLPLIGGHMFAGVSIEGYTAEQWPVVTMAPVSPGYFRTLAIPIVAGRLFDDSPARVALVNRAFAASYFPGRDAIGHRVAFPDGPREIIGIVGDVRQQGLRAEESPTMYIPSQQLPAPSMTLLVRSAMPPADLAAAVARAVREVDPDQPVFDVATMDQRLSGVLSGDRANMLLAAVFAAVALLLAAVGIFGTIAHFVGRRSHEIGIRMALGAERGDVLRMVLGRGILLAVAGIALGLAGALAVTRSLRTLLFEVNAADPLTLVGVALLFLVVAAAACYVPARRAIAVDPMVVLRHE
jgi:putative ABC transport system permease protein